MSNSCPTIESGQAGRAPSCEGCPNAAACASARVDPAISDIKKRLEKIDQTIAVMSGKGGVGKSTISVSLAHSIANRGINVLLVDLDISGPSIPRMTGTTDQFFNVLSGSIKPVAISEHLSTVSAGHLVGFDREYSEFSSSRKNDLIKMLFQRVDLSGIKILVIDTPPNISDEHLALAQYIKPDIAIMVSTPHKVAFNDVIRQISFCSKAEIPLLGVVENMRHFKCPRCSHINVWGHGKDIEKFCRDSSIDYLGSIELSPEVAKAADSGLPTSSFVFEHISDKILARLANLHPTNHL